MRAKTSTNPSVRGNAAFLLLCALVLWATPPVHADVSFADYMPITPAEHGVKTFEWTYGPVGQFTSQIVGSKAVHYGDGTTLIGTEVTNLGEPGTTALGYNDGTVVKILGTTEYYFSSDSKLTSHPSVWSFGTVADGMVVDQRPYCVVKYDRSYWSCESDQLVLFDIQDVTVLEGTYSDAIIMWTLDTQYSFADLDLADKRPDLRISPPTYRDTGGYSVTGFDVFGLHTGTIAAGDVDAESGRLVDLAELKAVVREGGFETADLAGTWSVHGIVVGKRPDQRPGWFHCQITFDINGRATWSPIVGSDGNQDFVPEPVTWAIDGYGAVSVPRVPPFHGVMNQKRDRIVAVATMAPGSPVSLRGDNLIIMQKQSGVAFATSDLAGTWSMHAVGTGDPPARQGWMHGDMIIDANGIFLEVPGCSRDSTGYSPGTGNGAMSLTSGGVIGIEGWPSMHGTLSESKDLAVYTHTGPDHPNDYGLSVSQRRSDAPFVKRDLSGVWRICGLSTQGGTWASCVHGTWTVNADGTSNGLLYKSDGTTSPLGGTVTVANYGVFRIDPFEYTHGVIGTDRDLIALVTTDSVGEHQMLIGTRTGAPAPCIGACQCQDDDLLSGIYRICNYLPLNPGNQWIYTTGDYTVLNETYMSSYGWSAVRLATRTYEFDVFTQNCENGLAIVARYDLCDDEFYEFDSPIVLIPPEMRIGDPIRKTYMWPDGSVSYLTTRLVGPETITVPTGKFNALRFDIDADDVGKCTYTTRLWLVKSLGIVKMHRVNATPANCGGCIFTCRCGDNLGLVNTPAELVSAIVDGKRY